ncbi:cysteine proteinase [Daldinia sp. FL1419]|nr:cysteine proteinase [Daldinia sp. FL1419]
MPSVQQHDWRKPVHCKFCRPCNRIRVRFNQEAHEWAHLEGQAQAQEIGISISPAPLYRARAIRIPRSNKSVTIQLPVLPRPVAPTDRTGLTRKDFARKRVYVAFLDSNSSESEETEIKPNLPEPHVGPVRYPPDLAREALVLNNENIIQETKNLPPSTLLLNARVGPSAASMPGAWPSELVEAESVEVPSYPGMHLPTTPAPAPRANFRNALAYIRDSSLNIYTSLSSKIFRPRQSPSAPTQTPALISSEDGRRTPKRRRLDRRENGFLAPTERFCDGFMDIDNPTTTTSTDLSTSEPETSPSMSPSISPNSAAARRAARFFSHRRRLESLSGRFVVVTPPPSRRETIPEPEQAPKTWGPLPPPKYANIQEFFAHDDEICLPGFERLQLSPNGVKIDELDSQREERLRIEQEKAEKDRQEQLRIEEERLNEALRPRGLRRPKAPLITPLSDEWDQKARNAPSNGRTELSKWKGARHKDTVQLEPRDFEKLVSTSWLNDNVIQETLVRLATHINEAAGITPKVQTPKCVALSSIYWSNYKSEPRAKIYARGLDRTWGMKPTNFHDIDTLLIPVNSNDHWTLLFVRPQRRTIAYIDSFHSPGERHIQDAFGWMRNFLGEKFIPDEWQIEHHEVPTQTNGYDCGMFVITNSIYLSLGIDPSGYSQSEMPLQRRRIAAMLLHGGFTGPFDLSHL